MKQTLVGKIRAAYDVAGDGPDVLLVHGWMASRRYWHRAPASLEGFRLWMLDLYGYGDSEKPMTGYTLDEYADFILDFLDIVKVKKVAIVGHSMGGSIAAWTVLKRPNSFTAICLVDAALSGRVTTPPKWYAEPIMRSFMRLADTSVNLGRMTVKSIFGVGDPESKMMLEEARKSDIRAATMCGDMMSTPTDWNGLRELRIPALTVYGTEDFLMTRGTPEDVISLLYDPEPHYIEDCGHLPMLEKPEEFYRILLSFLERTARR